MAFSIGNCDSNWKALNPIHNRSIFFSEQQFEWNERDENIGQDIKNYTKLTPFKILYMREDFMECQHINV